MSVNRGELVPLIHAKWIHCKGSSCVWYCSNCGEKIRYNQGRRTYKIEKRSVEQVNKYCRSCSAKMDEDTIIK